MKQNLFKRIFSKFFPEPSPEFIAGQLRRPSGSIAGKVAMNMNRSNEFMYDMVIERMKLADNESILEIGFGNGMFFKKVFSSAAHIKVSGIDFSEAMVGEAIENNKAMISSGSLTLKSGSSDKIPFPDNAFDKVFCINVIYFWEAPDDHVKEIYRVLKPGGKFYTGIRTRESMLQMPFTKYGFITYEPEEWHAVLEKNGFLPLETVRKTEPAIHFKGQDFRLESLCISAEKKIEK